MTASTNVLAGFAPDLLAGSRVLATGAAGGIGRAVAAAVRAVGATLFRLDRPEPLARMPAADGTPLPCDLADRVELRRAAVEAGGHGPLAALVHGAGAFRRAPLDGVDAEAAWDEALAPRFAWMAASVPPNPSTPRTVLQGRRPTTNRRTTPC